MPAPSNTAIETVSGLVVDLANPKSEDFRISDIAWSLSREARFGGHTITETPYTVGQHSVQVAKLIETALSKKSPLYEALLEFCKDDLETILFINDMHEDVQTEVIKLGLLHDASEAYLRDLPSPVKNLPGLREAYLAVEKTIMAQILVAFNVRLEGPILDMAWKIVRWADLYSLTVESYHFMPSRGSWWPAEYRLKIGLADLQKFENPKPALQVYEEFLSHLEYLNDGRR